ncbi:DedA family protein [Corynebacterium pseudotuberculosis 258]|uniref:DedA family protein n=1 Tax=Corynebacterium pseudotuberculosis 258 TaxID=1168865 RepID=A0AAU8Q4Z8_CORPS|nr:DedA family protein [Corynebacterium pseudotuberculosis]AFK17676.2 DedA family protein [Corynebacterium pseudotuberculosis 258]QGW57476.1 DedA family protein [Corynebacterium pseudotuberculosis CIP 52.97]
MTDFLHMLHDTQGLLASVGLIGLTLIIFAETGILLGFFLPGDSLLFAAGMLSNGDKPLAPLWVVCLTVGIAAFVGNEVGYFVGKKVGPAVMNSWAGRKIGIERLHSAEEFFIRRGAAAVFLGRFIPIVRTLVPVLAGMNKMNYKKFSLINLAGAIVWGMGVPVLGYLLGGIPFVRNNIEVLLLTMIFVSVIPVLIEFLRGRKNQVKTIASAKPAEYPQV